MGPANTRFWGKSRRRLTGECADIDTVGCIGQHRKKHGENLAANAASNCAGNVICCLAHFYLTAQNEGSIRENVRGEPRTNRLGTTWTATLVTPRQSSCQSAVR